MSICPRAARLPAFLAGTQGLFIAYVAGKTVTVTWDSRDRNGRIIGWVMAGEGICVNKVMVLAGYAWWYKKYAPDEFQFREAQEAAQEAKRGLWGEADAVAPWNWRQGKGSCRLITRRHRQSEVLQSKNLM